MNAQLFSIALPALLPARANGANDVSCPRASRP